MNRLCLTIACFSAVAWTQASAEGLASDPLKSHRTHAAKARHVAPMNAASLDEIHFSDPYAPPEGATVVRTTVVGKSGGLPGYSNPIPKEPHGGLSISMGQDGDGHTTGGLRWGF